MVLVFICDLQWDDVYGRYYFEIEQQMVPSTGSRFTEKNLNSTKFIVVLCCGHLHPRVM